MTEAGGAMYFLEDMGSGSCLADMFRRYWEKAVSVGFIVIVVNYHYDYAIVE